MQCCSRSHYTTPAGKISSRYFLRPARTISRRATDQPGLLPSGFFNATKTLLPPRWIKKSRFAPGLA